MRCCCSRIIRANEPISDLSASYREGIERRHAQHDEANLPTTATMKALNQENEAISKGEKTNDDEVSPLIDVMNAALPQNYQQEKSRAVDECIAEDFLKMSIADRNSVADEIAGKSCMAREETPEMLAASLARLDVELNAIPLKKKIGYLQSQKFSKTYINDCNFRLRFLRAELFEAREAAVRLAKYCDFVLELFGSVALQRKIWLSDFDRKEIKWIQMGYIQMLPFRDSFGRRVILQIIDASVLREKRVRLKTFIFLALVASEDLETQRKGVVLIVWPGGPCKDWRRREPSDGRLSHLITQRHEVVPIRYAAFHYCMPDNPFFRIVRSFAVLYGGIGSGTKSRMKLHVGEDTEVRYALGEYGIPVDLIPVTGTGNIKTNHHKPWIKIRVMVDMSAHDDDKNGANGSLGRIVECPGSTDVIFKPGKRLMCHPGNVLFEELVVSRIQGSDFTASKRETHRWLANEITKKRGGRFLKWNDEGYWEKMEDEDEISVKISTACKTVLKKVKQKGSGSRIVVESSTFAFQENNLGRNVGDNGTDQGRSRKRPFGDCFCGDTLPDSK